MKPLPINFLLIKTQRFIQNHFCSFKIGRFMTVLENTWKQLDGIYTVYRGTTLRSNKNYMKIFFSIIPIWPSASECHIEDYRKKYFHIIFIRPKCCSPINYTCHLHCFGWFRVTEIMRFNGHKRKLLVSSCVNIKLSNEIQNLH